MAKHGFDTAKLEDNLDRLLGGWVDSGMQPCVHALVLRHGEVAYDKAHGWLNIESGTKNRQDAIYRIYSMTKVFTSVAMLMLLEEGRYKMHDPLSKYVPAFGHSRVAARDAAGKTQLVSPNREIVIRDLFTMASGLPYPGEGTLSELSMAKAIARCEADEKKGIVWDANRLLEEVATTVPLAFHPGEHWWYGFSIDVLGALVSILSGQSLWTFLRERIFQPLGLSDTGFTVPEQDLSRFVTMYNVDGENKLIPVSREEDESHYYRKEAFESGGGGLVSTAQDVSRLAEMLLGFGAANGKRLLSRKSVELMRMNHLSPQQLLDYNWDTQRGYGYGLAVRTMMDPAKAGYGSVGEFGWDGAAGSWFCMDPAEDMACIFLVQTMPGRHYQFVPLFAQTVYGAIAD